MMLSSGAGVWRFLLLVFERLHDREEVIIDEMELFSYV